MKQNREKEVQEKITQFLLSNGISPFSVIFTYCFDDGGLLGLTFWLKSEVEEFLNLVEYKSLCDRKGYLILENNNTVIISGFALIDFYSKVQQYGK